jgi:hypothetical protein
MVEGRADVAFESSDQADEDGLVRAELPGGDALPRRRRLTNLSPGETQAKEL